MARGTDPLKRRQWSARLSRYAQSRQTVAQFCEAEGVSTASFFQWKRKLGPQARPKEPSETPATAKFHPVRVALADSSAAVTIRLPDGAVIELGDDARTIELVLDRLLSARPSKGAKPC